MLRLPVLPRPPSGEGCIHRCFTELSIGDETIIEVYHSRCQTRLLATEFRDRADALAKSGLSTDEVQLSLQSFINGRSPCDREFACDEDRLTSQEIRKRREDAGCFPKPRCYSPEEIQEAWEHFLSQGS